MDPSGATIVVTGGAGAIGQTIVAALLDVGAAPVVVDRNRDATDAVARRHPDVPAYCCDLTDELQVTDTFSRIATARGAFHGLVHAAGRIHSEPLNSPFREPNRHTLAQFSAVISDNLTTAFLAGACAADEMLRRRDRGVLVLLTSIAAHGNPGQSAYSAAKAGADSLVRVWGQELAPSGIRAVGVAPGFVDTPSTREALSERAIKERERGSPLRRLGRPDEIAHAVVFAIENDYLNATTLHVDGGTVL